MAIISATEAARMCGVTVQTIRNWGKRGLIVLKKQRRQDGREMWFAYKEQIDEICSVSQDVEETKLLLKAEQEDLIKKTKEVMEAKRELLLDLGVYNSIGRNSCLYLICSLVEMVNMCGAINEREKAVLIKSLNGDTFEEIGKGIGLTRERVRKIFILACRRIKDAQTIIDRMNEYEDMKAEYHSIIESGKLLQKENEMLRESLNIRKKEDELKNLQERITYLEEKDQLCKLLSTQVKGITYKDWAGNNKMLSVRTLNCLRWNEINTLGDLVKLSKNDLLKLRNFGRKSLTEIDDMLESFGLDYNMDVERLYLERAELYFNDNN